MDNLIKVSFFYNDLTITELKNLSDGKYHDMKFFNKYRGTIRIFRFGGYRLNTVEENVHTMYKFFEKELDGKIIEVKIVPSPAYVILLELNVIKYNREQKIKNILN